MTVRYCTMGARGGSIVASPPADGALISAAVGSGGVNLRSDVVVIQALLNLVPTLTGGPAKLLKVDGIAGTLTVAAIRRFQSSINLGFSDGRIDPRGQTLARLSAVRSSSRGPSAPGPAFAVTGTIGAPGPG